MKQDSKAFYRERYLMVIHDGEDVVEVVNNLAESIMRNDSEAMDVVCRVIYYKFYDLALYYAKKSAWSPDYADAILDQACEDFFKLCIRGLQESVLTQGIYGLLQNTVYHAYLHMINKNKIYSQKTQFENENSDDIERINAKNKRNENISTDMLSNLIEKEEAYSDKKVIDFFRQALIENKEVPYQIVTYCYASLLPLMFKESQNPDFLKNINIMSARGNGNSWYSDGKIGGDIGRKSFVLLNWALDAMNAQKTGELSAEFERLYQQEPVVGLPFCWGKEYLSALKKKCDDKKIEDIVITDEFETVRIKNWSARVGKHLYEDTKKRMSMDKEFRRFAVGRAEKIILDLRR